MDIRMLNLPNGMNLNTKHGESLLIRIFISLVGSLLMTNSVNLSSKRFFVFIRNWIAVKRWKYATFPHKRSHNSLFLSEENERKKSNKTFTQSNGEEWVGLGVCPCVCVCVRFVLCLLPFSVGICCHQTTQTNAVCHHWMIFRVHSCV